MSPARAAAGARRDRDCAAELAAAKRVGVEGLDARSIWSRKFRSRSSGSSPDRMARAAMRDPRPSGEHRSSRSATSLPLCSKRTSMRDRRSSWHSLGESDHKRTHRRALVGPYPEARQRVGPNVLLIATSEASRPRANQDPADARKYCCAGRKCTNAREEGLEPSSEVHRAVWRRYPDVAQVARCSSARGCSCTAEGNGQVCIVRGRRRSDHERLPALCESCARVHTRRRCVDGHSRR